VKALNILLLMVPMAMVLLTVVLITLMRQLMPKSLAGETA